MVGVFFVIDRIIQILPEEFFVIHLLFVGSDLMFNGRSMWRNERIKLYDPFQCIDNKIFFVNNSNFKASEFNYK